MSIAREPGFMAPRIFLEDRGGLWIGWRALSQIPRVRSFCVTHRVFAFQQNLVHNVQT